MLLSWRARRLHKHHLVLELLRAVTLTLASTGNSHPGTPKEPCATGALKGRYVSLREITVSGFLREHSNDFPYVRTYGTTNVCLSEDSVSLASLAYSQGSSKGRLGPTRVRMASRDDDEP